MKKGSFAGQLYREFYLARKSYITGLIMFAAWAVFGWLTLVSFRYGNIGKLVDYIAAGNGGNVALDPEIFDYEGLQQKIKSVLFLYLKGFPALMTLSFLFSGADIAGKDELSTWQRYAKCTPVTPARRAAIKTLMNFIAAAAAFVLSIGYISFIDVLIGESITYREITVLVSAVSAVTVLAVVAQVYIRFFRGMDKGMLALIVTVIAVEFAAFSLNTPKLGENVADIDFIGLCEEIFPFTPIIFFGALAVDFGLMYALYKRREK